MSRHATVKAAKNVMETTLFKLNPPFSNIRFARIGAQNKKLLMSQRLCTCVSLSPDRPRISHEPRRFGRNRQIVSREWPSQGTISPFWFLPFGPPRSSNPESFSLWALCLLYVLPSASPKPHPCNMSQAKTEVALQCSESCAAEVALQHSLFCSANVISPRAALQQTKNCIAKLKKLYCKKLGLSCRFPADYFRLPRLGSRL